MRFRFANCTTIYLALAFMMANSAPTLARSNTITIDEIKNNIENHICPRPPETLSMLDYKSNCGSTSSCGTDSLCMKTWNECSTRVDDANRIIVQYNEFIRNSCRRRSEVSPSGSSSSSIRGNADQDGVLVLNKCQDIYSSSKPIQSSSEFDKFIYLRSVNDCLAKSGFENEGLKAAVASAAANAYSQDPQGFADKANRLDTRNESLPGVAAVKNANAEVKRPSGGCLRAQWEANGNIEFNNECGATLRVFYCGKHSGGISDCSHDSHISQSDITPGKHILGRQFLNEGDRFAFGSCKRSELKQEDPAMIMYNPDDGGLKFRCNN